MKLSEEEIKRIIAGEEPNFTIQDLADAAGLPLTTYAKNHGISKRTAEKWGTNEEGKRQSKGYILLGLYYWDKYQELHKRMKDFFDCFSDNNKK